MRILITGANGLVGTALKLALIQRGDSVQSLSRDPNQKPFWDPDMGLLNKQDLEGFDAIIHLAGENLAQGRWSSALKKRIRESRIKGTSLLTNKLSEVKQKPKKLLCASAIGIYGDHKDDIVTENTKPAKQSFLSDLVQEWEAAAFQAPSGIDVTCMRFGVIFSEKGGALPKILTPFKLGTGGMLGNGQQYMSWITLDDVISAIIFLLDQQDATGSFNIVSPNPITNAEFTNTLGKVLGKPTAVTVPAFAAKLLFGEMAEALLLCSTRTIPEKLQKLGYQFKYPNIEHAMQHVLK
ncbi:MAG: TIGR01777 family oxidoreductase [Parachlamydiales bacterium]|nr:TIGR01777 family oxidoreductase [Parachlamydiales bacterium]